MRNSLFSLFVVGVCLLGAPMSCTFAAEELSHEGHNHDQGDHEGHDHDADDFDYLYGNHYCPPCNYADLVDPHSYADIKNEKAKIYGRVYLCYPGCAEAVKKNMGKYYTEVYRTNRKTGKKIPARKLTNQVCPVTGDTVDGKTVIEYNGMIVNFSSNESAKAFLKEPEKGMRKLLPKEKKFKFQGNKEHKGHHNH